MGRLITVKIDSDDMIEMLCDRLSDWAHGVSYDLFSEYYKMAVEEGWYDNSEFNPMIIVDNDWVNDMEVITKDEFDDFDIKDEDDERIVLTDGKGNYLITTY